MFFLYTNGSPQAKKYRAKSLICNDIMLHIFTCSSDKDFVNTEAAHTVIFSWNTRNILFLFRIYVIR